MPAWALAAAMFVALPPPDTISIEPGDRAVMLFSTPKGASLVTPSSDVLRIAGALLKEHTSVRLASPEQAGQIDVLLRILRDRETPPLPIRVEITNANELAPAGKVMTIKRNDSGKMTGALVESVPGPT